MSHANIRLLSQYVISIDKELGNYPLTTSILYAIVERGGWRIEEIYYS